MTRAADRVDVRALPAVLDLPEAARILGISRTAAYELVRTGSWPTPVLRLGHRIKIPTQPLLELIGLSTSSAQGVAPLSSTRAG
jgi:predicted DNA-binding transcriptional regulator AlpA